MAVCFYEIMQKLLIVPSKEIAATNGYRLTLLVSNYERNCKRYRAVRSCFGSH